MEKDQRQYKRINFEKEINCSPLDKEDHYYCISQDISQSGIRFKTSRNMQVDSKVRIRMKLLSGKTVSFSSKICWIHETLAHESFETGAEFLRESFDVELGQEENPESQQNIFAYLKNLTDNPISS